MEKLTLPHRLPTLAALAPTPSPLLQQRFMEKETSPEPERARIAPSSQELRHRNSPVKSPGGSTRECEKQHRAPGLVLAQKSVLPRLKALAEPWSAQAVSLACLCWYLVRALHKRPARARHRALSRHLLAAYGALQDRLGAASASLLEAVEAVLHQRHRASSAIEGFNAALRPYLYVHKGATQGFLDLFRAWFNLRTRRWGRHKGTSAHECLTGQRVHDWLTLLGRPPSPTLH